MDLLYESDHKLGEMDNTDMGEILDHDVFQSPSPTSSDDYMEMDNDWLNSLFEDPVLNDKMITEAAQPPRIQNEHSYSINNETPASPLGLSKIEDLETSLFGSNQALDLTTKLPISTNATLPVTSPVKSEPLEQRDPMLTTVTTMTTRTLTSTKQPTIILATTTSPQITPDNSMPQVIATTMLSPQAATPTVTIKAEPQDFLDSQMEQTVNMDSLILPPTPPSSASSDSEGGLSPQRSAPSSPVRQMSSYSKHHSSSSKPYSQPIFTNPVSLLCSNSQYDPYHIPQSGVLILSEEEKRTLVSEGYPIPAKLPLTKQEEKNLKKIRRKIKNKISAQESRRKKKEYLETLEKRVEAFSQENNDLKKKVDSLETNNRTLLGQLQKLQSLVGKVTRPGPAASGTGTALMVLVLCFAVFLGGGWSPSSLNIGYSPSSSFQNAAFFGNPRTVQPSPRMGPTVRGPKVDDYSTPNMRSRVLLSMKEEGEESSYYEPYTPFGRNKECIEEPKEDKVDRSVINPVPIEMTSGGSSKVRDVVTVDQRVNQPNKTEGNSRDQQAMLHPDIEATAGFLKSHSDNAVETA